MASGTTREIVTSDPAVGDRDTPTAGSVGATSAAYDPAAVPAPLAADSGAPMPQGVAPTITERDGDWRALHRERHTAAQAESARFYQNIGVLLESNVRGLVREWERTR